MEYKKVSIFSKSFQKEMKRRFNLLPKWKILAHPDLVSLKRVPKN